jgi:hypothetical protein
MRAIFAGIMLAFAISSANATTYNYVGNPFTDFSQPGVIPGECNPTACTNITGSVTFNFDTSNYTGQLSLAPGDTATLFYGIFGLGLLALPPTYPSSSLLPDMPPGRQNIVASITGSLTLTNGSVTSWFLEGSTLSTNCGGGPGCAVGNGAITTSQSGDFTSIEGIFPQYASASNTNGGNWTEVEAVPELSTWAMLLIGFASIGFAGYRRSRRLDVT